MPADSCLCSEDQGERHGEDFMGFRSGMAALAGVVLGSAATFLFVTSAMTDAPTGTSRRLEADVAALQVEVERLKGIAADTSHAMMDVDYHVTNLWFAARGGNWPLAGFYWKATRSHLEWATRILPIRKDDAGHDVNVQAILEAFENSPYLTEVGDSIQARDPGKFEVRYRRLLEACHTCHKAAGRPYLRPRVPEATATAILQMGPGEPSPK
jgi:hypothetical protein